MHRRKEDRKSIQQSRFAIELLEARHLLAGNPIISEFLTRNDGFLRDGDGRTPDYIEIHNAGDETVNLGGYHLTDDAEELEKWTFPDIELGAGQYMVVFASGQDSSDYVDADGHLHTNFSLKRGGEYLALVDPDVSILSRFGTADQDYPEQLPNVSYGPAQSAVLVSQSSPSRFFVPNGPIGDWQSIEFDAAAAGFTEGTASLGLETSSSSRNSFQGQFQTELPEQTLAVYNRIEFELSEPSTITGLQLRIKYDDGFVASINGNTVAKDNAPSTLSWFSTAADRRSDRTSLDWMEIDLSDHIDRLVSGTNVLGLHGLNHLSDRTGMMLVAELTASAADLEAVVGVPTRVGYMATPTPGQPNVSSEEVYSDFVADTAFSVDRGFYDQPQRVEITTATSDAEIYFTTDGSPPMPENSAATLYSEPVVIQSTTPLRAAAYREDYLPTNVDTQTYVFLDDVVRQNDQSARAAGFPARWGSQTPDYEMDQRVVDEYGVDAIKQSLLSVPTVAISVKNDDLFGPEGIYTRAESRGARFERPASVEWIHPDGVEGFQIDAGIRIQGGAFRSYGLTHKNSFRLLFKGEYGATKLNYPVFGDGDDVVQEFDTLTLRMESNDGWQWGAAGGQPQFARDEFHRRTHRMMGQPSPHGNFIQVYINGIYWGHYNIVERPDAAFAEAYLDVDKEDWDGFNAAFDRGSVINADSDRPKQGRAVEAWNTMVDFTADIQSSRSERAKTAIYMAMQGKNPDGTNNPQLRSHLDVDSYIDYMILNHWGANTDWPRKNFYVGGENSDSSEGFKFFSWDAEWTLTLRNSVRENRLNDFAGVGLPLRGLRESEEFSVAWADRVHKHFFNGGPLYVDPRFPNWDPAHPERNIPAATYVQVTNEVFDPILAESARWGDQHRSSRPYTRDREWQAEKEKLLDSWFPLRSDIVLGQYIAAGLYPEVAAPAFSQHGGNVASGFSLTMTNSGDGVILYTLNGSDPRLVGGDANPDALLYNGDAITLEGPTTVKARLLNAGEWSALNEAVFIVGDIRITEINYSPHPANSLMGVNEPAVDSDEFEFIELTNTSDATIDLSSFAFVDGIEFTFPRGASMDAGERAVIVGDLASFQARYGAGRRILGEYSGRLSNDGERLAIADSNQQTIFSVEYDVDQGWPTRANGGGSTLEIIDPKGTPSAANWRASSQFGGSPGVVSPSESPVGFSEVLANSRDQNDQIELKNSSGAPINIGGWYISDVEGDPLKYQIPSGMIIPPFGYSAFEQSEFAFGLNGSRGGRLYLVESNADGTPIRFADEISFGASLPGVSLGPDSDGDWTQLAQLTLGDANSQPRRSDVVITEIHYNPIDPDGNGNQRSSNYQFIEIVNTTNNVVDLSGWRLGGSATLDFEDGSTLAPGQTALLVPFRSTSSTIDTLFRFAYDVPPDTVFYYQYEGSPEDGASEVRLIRAGVQSPDEPGFVPTFVEDHVDFALKSPWPALEAGQSLQRNSSRVDGGIASNWRAADPTAGQFEDSVPQMPGDANHDGQFNQVDIVQVLQSAKYLAGQPASFEQGDWNGDGFFDQQDIVAALQSGRYLQGPLTVRTMDSADVTDQKEDAEWVNEDRKRTAIDRLFALI